MDRSSLTTQAAFCLRSNSGRRLDFTRQALLHHAGRCVDPGQERVVALDVQRTERDTAGICFIGELPLSVAGLGRVVRSCHDRRLDTLVSFIPGRLGSFLQSQKPASTVQEASQTTRNRFLGCNHLHAAV